MPLVAGNNIKFHAFLLFNIRLIRTKNKRNMVRKIGSYKFSNEIDYNAAKDEIYYRMCSDYNNFNKIYFHENYDSDYLIDVYNECTDPCLVEQICLVCRGEPYNK